MVDGDTINVGDARVRLHGVDALENAQICGTWSGRNELPTAGSRKKSRCPLRAVRRSARPSILLATSPPSRAAPWMAPISARRWSPRGWRWLMPNIMAPMCRARPPLGWRGGHLARRGRGALRLVACQAQRPDGFRARPGRVEAGGCASKGNISGRGRIYYMPSNPLYGRTKIDTSAGERWFCDESDARRAGWRPAGS